jgi:hypothetical protein
LQKKPRRAIIYVGKLSFPVKIIGKLSFLETKTKIKKLLVKDGYNAKNAPTFAKGEVGALYQRSNQRLTSGLLHGICFKRNFFVHPALVALSGADRRTQN